MSSEDAEARADAIRFADAHVPMSPEQPKLKTPPSPENPRPACERCNYGTHACPGCGLPLEHGTEACAQCGPPGRVDLVTPENPVGTIAARRGKLSPEQRAERDRVKQEEREAKAAGRLRLREEAKVARALERAEAKLEAFRAKVREAEGGTVRLPAVVLRDGTVRHVSGTDAWAVIEMYLSDLCLDVEHSGYPLGHRLYELRTVQLGGEHAAVVFDASDPAQMQVASLALTLAGRLRAHSATADIIPCVAAGLIEWDAAWAKTCDSVLNAKLTDPAMSGSDADSLKELAADLLREYAVSPNAEKDKNALFAAMGCLVNTGLTTPPEKNGWNCVNRYSVVMTRYAGSDVLDLGAVLRVLPPLPVDESVLDREREFQAACAPVTHTGFKLNYPHVLSKIEEHEKERDEAKANVLILSDGRIINPKSPDVIKLLPEVIPGLVLPVHPKTKKPSADKASLEKIADTDDPLTRHLAREILRYRHCDTTLGLLLRPFALMCEQGDGRGRTTIYTIEASTGRTSSRRFNAQQISRQGGIRACIEADEGMLGISADFAGCEICVAAGLSGDHELLKAETSPFCHKCEADDLPGAPCGCPDKADGTRGSHTGLHWLAAHLTFGPGAVKEDRYKCKAVIFRKLFGGAPDSEVAKKIADVFDNEIAPGYSAWDRWLRKCYKEGSMVWRDYATGQNFSQPIEGSRRMVYRTYSGRNIYSTNGEHAAGNGAIQGTARELLVDGVLNWRKTKWGRLPLLPVHDQVLTFVPAGEAQEASRELARCMETSVLSSPGFEVKIGVDVDEPFLAWPDSS